ncbi:uncharacterized protein CLUP02_17475 [Colletotrichum lupini]|uniref:Uncharacterized protein n=1 Tax=Colletotrichum lupini TaxID=145971 RepID=A0A9Q8WAE7_9PEZI|nr:uncharacterized protein CLUP02_17475 [Colletotrichum lupini]UQC75966.1 hypothetical protein CLUP02_17475 [Colletotrichum lupini]
MWARITEWSRKKKKRSEKLGMRAQNKVPILLHLDAWFIDYYRPVMANQTCEPWAERLHIIAEFPFGMDLLLMLSIRVALPSSGDTQTYLIHTQYPHPGFGNLASMAGNFVSLLPIVDETLASVLCSEHPGQQKKQARRRMPPQSVVLMMYRMTLDGWTAVGIPSSTHPDDDSANAAIPSRALFILPPSSESQIIPRIPLLELAAVDIQSEAKGSLDELVWQLFSSRVSHPLTKVHPRASLPIRKRDRIGEKKKGKTGETGLLKGLWGSNKRSNGAIVHPLHPDWWYFPMDHMDTKRPSKPCCTPLRSHGIPKVGRLPKVIPRRISRTSYPLDIAGGGVVHVARSCCECVVFREGGRFLDFMDGNQGQPGHVVLACLVHRDDNPQRVLIWVSKGVRPVGCSGDCRPEGPAGSWAELVTERGWCLTDVPALPMVRQGKYPSPMDLFSSASPFSNKTTSDATIRRSVPTQPESLKTTVKSQGTETLINNHDPSYRGGTPRGTSKVHLVISTSPRSSLTDLPWWKPPVCPFAQTAHELLTVSPQPPCHEAVNLDLDVDRDQHHSSVDGREPLEPAPHSHGRAKWQIFSLLEETCLGPMEDNRQFSIPTSVLWSNEVAATKRGCNSRRVLNRVALPILNLYYSRCGFLFLSFVETCFHDHGQFPLHRGLGKPDTNERDWQMASARLLQQIKLVRVRPVLQLCICICIASWSTLASGCGYLDDPSSQPNLKTSSHTSCIHTNHTVPSISRAQLMGRWITYTRAPEPDMHHIPTTIVWDPSLALETSASVRDQRPTAGSLHNTLRIIPYFPTQDSQHLELGRSDYGRANAQPSSRDSFPHNIILLPCSCERKISYRQCIRVAIAVDVAVSHGRIADCRSKIAHLLAYGSVASTRANALRYGVPWSSVLFV